MHKERFGGKAEKYSSCLPKNTQYISGSSYETPFDSLIHLVPEKIKNRLKINKMGLNGLATTIVDPDVKKGFNEDSLRGVVEFSNRINHSIGLPETDSVIVRTSNPKTLSYFSNRRPKFSEPALLAKGLQSPNPTYDILLEGNKQPISGLEEFRQKTSPDSFLIIHDDNYRMQMQSLHGRIGRTANRNEIILATNVLHPRGLGENDPKYPLIRLESDYFEDIGEIDVAGTVGYVNGDTELQSSRLKMQFKNCTRHMALYMLKKLRHDFLLLSEADKKSREEFGESSVVEFRSYNILEGGVGSKFHVLDVNSRF